MAPWLSIGSAGADAGAVPRKSLDLQQRLDTVFRRNMAFDKASKRLRGQGLISGYSW